MTSPSIVYNNYFNRKIKTSITRITIDYGLIHLRNWQLFCHFRASYKVSFGRRKNSWNLMKGKDLFNKLDTWSLQTIIFSPRPRIACSPRDRWKKGGKEPTWQWCVSRAGRQASWAGGPRSWSCHWHTWSTPSSRFAWKCQRSRTD